MSHMTTESEQQRCRLFEALRSINRVAADWLDGNATRSELRRECQRASDVIAQDMELRRIARALEARKEEA